MSRDYGLDKGPTSGQRVPEYARDDAWIREFLARTRNGRIATRWDDQPFITPTTIWYDAARHEIIFHSGNVGRMRANIERHNRVCFEASESGRFLPSNTALEFSVQYRSVVAFGTVRILKDPDEKRRALYGLIEHCFPGMSPGEEYRPITDNELARTTVYAMTIKSWSGKENWKQQASQSDEWPPLMD
jgi:nitroimidazol reductase NimA-like FMN-containing flavoprotein (pyridoxamine 5'-phosphate oxidase superfamily)